MRDLGASNDTGRVAAHTLRRLCGQREQVCSRRQVGNECGLSGLGHVEAKCKAQKPVQLLGYPMMLCCVDYSPAKRPHSQTGNARQKG